MVELLPSLLHDSDVLPLVAVRANGSTSESCNIYLKYTVSSTQLFKREGWVYYVDFVATRAAQSLPLGRV